EAEPKSEDHNSPAIIADAIFFRLRSTAVSQGAGENEFFHYDPSATGSVNQKSVIIKGIEPFAAKTLADSRHIKLLDVDTRIAAYRLQGVEPDGVYESLEWRNPDPGYWESIMSARASKDTGNHNNRINTPGGYVIYGFLGPLFAMTNNKGVTWSVWDAERDIPCTTGWAEAEIKDVNIGNDGNGTMRVEFTSIKRALELVTNDYGKHWRC